MLCSEFKTRIDLLREGLLSPEELLAAEDHLATCVACRKLASVSPIRLDIPPLEIPQDLVRSVMKRTSGPACGRAREHLCEFVDGVLEPGYSELLSLHVAGCRECSALAEALTELKATLPQMGELEPGVSFTFSVLRATSRNLPEPRLSPWLRLQQWWQRLIQRPRFSWEAAYLGTILLIGVLGNPLTAVRDLSLRAAAAMESRSTFSWVAVSLPGSLLHSDTGVLKDVRGFAGAVTSRQEELAKSAEGFFGQAVGSLLTSVQSDFRSSRELPAKASSALRRAWAALFPTRSK